ncbi:DUF4214 domain-containing protein [bacterium]|nr:DUF4214 domain-containing protein [bacterium]
MIIFSNGIESSSCKPLTDAEWILMDLCIIQLADHYSTPSNGFVKMLYDNILGRVPDEPVLNLQKIAYMIGIFTGA